MDERSVSLSRSDSDSSYGFKANYKMKHLDTMGKPVVQWINAPVASRWLRSVINNPGEYGVEEQKDHQP